MVAYMAEQLEVDLGAFALYSRRYNTRFDHNHRLAQYLGVRTATRPTHPVFSQASSIRAMAGAVRRSRHGRMLGGSALPVSRSQSMPRKSPGAAERRLGMTSFPSLRGTRATI